MAQINLTTARGMKNMLQFGISGLALSLAVAAQAATLSITSITLVGGNPQLRVQSDTGITNQVLCKTNLSQTNWVLLTNFMVAESPYLFVDVSTGSASRRFYRVIALTNTSALIPAGSFTIGDSLDGESDATPISVTVSAFYMDINVLSYGRWQSVYNWATSHGYGFDYAGSGKAANHPVQTVDWWDAVKWSNARSQQAGLIPVYYTDADLTQVYTNGQGTPYVKWTASGYRLPTEAEWEKAARGGLVGKRFPWGDTISESQANYDSDTTRYSYDLGPSGFNGTYATNAYPYTSPVGSFAANGYGLYDMAGNIWEWCWDWHGTPYAGGSDPHGPATGSNRVLRGGDWFYYPDYARCANRGYNLPSTSDDHIGFRCVRGL